MIFEIFQHAYTQNTSYTNKITIFYYNSPLLSCNASRIAAYLFQKSFQITKF